MSEPTEMSEDTVTTAVAAGSLETADEPEHPAEAVVPELADEENNAEAPTADQVVVVEAAAPVEDSSVDVDVSSVEVVADEVAADEVVAEEVAATEAG